MIWIVAICLSCSILAAIAVAGKVASGHDPVIHANQVGTEKHRRETLAMFWLACWFAAIVGFAVAAVDIGLSDTKDWSNWQRIMYLVLSTKVAAFVGGATIYVWARVNNPKFRLGVVSRIKDTIGGLKSREDLLLQQLKEVKDELEQLKEPADERLLRDKVGRQLRHTADEFQQRRSLYIADRELFGDLIRHLGDSEDCIFRRGGLKEKEYNLSLMEDLEPICKDLGRIRLQLMEMLPQLDQRYGIGEAKAALRSAIAQAEELSKAHASRLPPLAQSLETARSVLKDADGLSFQ